MWSTDEKDWPKSRIVKAIVGLLYGLFSISLLSYRLEVHNLQIWLMLAILVIGCVWPFLRAVRDWTVQNVRESCIFSFLIGGACMLALARLPIR